MKSFHVFAVLAFVTTVVGCSGGGRNNVPGRQCPLNYVPIDLNYKANQKTWKKGDNDSAIPAGSYAYQGSNLIYTEKGDKGLVVHIEDVGDRVAVFKARVNCVRNGINLTEKNLSLVANVASKMVAAAGAKLDVEARELSFKVVNRGLVAESKPVSEKPDSLEKAFGGKADELFVIQTVTPVDYEVRSVYSDNNGSYVVAVRFKKIN